MDHETREFTGEPSDRDAFVNARDHVAELADRDGRDSPGFATALNQLALLLIMRGDPDAAEPLLREALEVRRASLGESHPDVATSLGSLGGLLWARGHLDQAEPLLRQAVDVRSATLGASHPKSVAGLRGLEQFLKAKTERVGLTPPDLAHMGDPSAAEEAPASQPSGEKEGKGVSEEFAARFVQVERMLTELGDRLTRVGERLRAGCLPDVDDLTGEWSGVRERFERYRLDVTQAAESESVPLPTGGLASLADISALLPTLREAEESRLAAESGRREALGVLDRVDRLVCRNEPDFAPLVACRAQSRALRTMIESAGRGVLHEAARLLKVGAHPFNHLLALVTADEVTGDAQWADWFDAVSAAFGDPLATAAARSRIKEDPGLSVASAGQPSESRL